MKTVLWISRHELTPEQADGLRRICGGSFRLVRCSDTVEDIGQLHTQINEADMVAAVFSVFLLADLVQAADGKPVLVSVSGRRATGRTLVFPDGSTEKEFRFEHICWRQITQLSCTYQTL